MFFIEKNLQGFQKFRYFLKRNASEINSFFFNENSLFII